MKVTPASAFNPCILIPVYNHAAVVESTVKLLVARGLDIVMVNDGSDPQHHAILQRLAHDHTQVHLVTHARNRGKGAAVKTGLREAHRLGFSHALQVDADGQHDLGDIDCFLEAARAHPGALIAGHPVYDASVPRLRFYSRYLSHVLVWLNTLSFTIIDSMCGFRVYPLPQSCALLKRAWIGNRMDFDGEFIVRWYWAGHPLVQLPTRVVYPVGGTSHFRYLRDNVLITIMHAKLFLLMLLQLPKLLLWNLRLLSPRPEV